jgi:Right handed beta helix region
MSARTNSPIVFGVLASFCLTDAAVGGPLTPPPGPVSPTNKTLNEVEPRIAVNAINTPGSPTTMFTISAPGSYYLTENITVPFLAGLAGIEISASDVTLDLGGFEMSVIGPGLTTAIIISTPVLPPILANVRVHNGTIVGWDAGITSGVDGVTIEDVDIRGCTSAGIAIAGNSIVRRCSSTGNGGSGIVGGILNTRLIDCTFSFNGFDGVELDLAGTNSVLRRVTANSNAEQGILVGSSSILSECTANENGLGAVATPGDGISVGFSSMVTECTTSGNFGSGITAVDPSGPAPAGAGSTIITGCTSTFDVASFLPDSAGIEIDHGIVDHCTVMASGYDGISVVSGIGASQITSCNVQSAALNGIHLLDFAEVRECSVQASAASGILVDMGSSASRIVGNTLRGNGFGIPPALLPANGGIQVADAGGVFLAPITNCLVEDNYMAGNDAGLVLGPFTASCTVIRNVSSGNPFPSPGLANYIILGGPHDVAPIGPADAPLPMSPFANIDN